MIIQCKQCRTKFRFDDAQMEGDGLWMRCSRCQHVFFQENPQKKDPAAVLPQVPPVSSGDVTYRKEAGRLSFEPMDAARSKTPPDDDVRSFLQDVLTQEKTTAGREEPKFKPAGRAGRNLDDIEFSPGEENLEEIGDGEEIPEAEPAPPVRKKSRGGKIALWIWSILVIIVIPVILCFVIFPQWGERYLQIVRKYISVSQPADVQTVTAQVKLQDIRQRVINNYVLGNIRVVEGTAVNLADFSVARIKVKAEILDAYSVVLDERVSYAGNILTEEDLTNLAEEEIMKKLSMPEGRENSNERVIPNGRIPFMIVFTRDRPGTIKTTVTIIGAERLL